MQRLPFLAVPVVVFVLTVPAVAQEPRTSTRPGLALSGRVERTDLSSRSVVLRTADGLMHTIYVSPNLAIFRELKSGDAVTVRIVESVVVAAKPNARPTAVTDKTAAAKQASTTSDVQQQLTAIVTVNSVDPAAQTIVYTGGDNRRVLRAVSDPGLLTGLKAGDVIEITYTRERAIELERAR